MSEEHNAQDPLEFVSRMWSNMGFPLPGMVTPTLDIDELDKRIHDLKAVEHWLKMNLNMLQMTTQGLEMQRAALAAVKAMSEQVSECRTTPEAQVDAANPFTAAAMWPWNFMNSQSPDAAGKTDDAASEKPKTKSRSSGTRASSGSKTRDKR